MRRAFVHIGTPRTGTTTLQRVLFSHRAELAGAGILYPNLTPSRAAEPHLSHQHLGEALAGRRAAADRIELLTLLDGRLAETTCDTVILSYEALCLMPAAVGAPKLLCDLFSRHGIAVHPVLTVKPQVEYLNSTYTWRMQFLREARLFPDFFSRHLEARDLDYARLVAPWCAASGQPAIAVPVRDARDGRPLIGRVFAALGLEDRTASIVNENNLALVENRSPGALAIEVCRRLRLGGADLALGGTARDATRLVEREARSRGWDGVAFMGHDEPLRARAAARWSDSNERFARQVWNAGWTECVAPEPARPMNEIARSPFSADAEAAIRSILQLCCDSRGIRLHGAARSRALRAAVVPMSAFSHLHRQARLFLRG
jgi:hypothetical protein